MLRHALCGSELPGASTSLEALAVNDIVERRCRLYLHLRRVQEEEIGKSVPLRGLQLPSPRSLRQEHDQWASSERDQGRGEAEQAGGGGAHGVHSVRGVHWRAYRGIRGRSWRRSGSEHCGRRKVRW